NYGIEVNNCFDYNIAVASSYYNKNFLQYYCMYWSLFHNWNWEGLNNNIDIQKEILNRLGLENNCINGISTRNIINEYRKQIDQNRPVIFNVKSSALFYSIMYRLKHSGNHSLIISGYDETRNLTFIRENSINSELISFLIKNRPISLYQLTDDMIIDIFTSSAIIYDNNGVNNYPSYALSYIEKKIDISNKEIEEDIIKCICKSFENKDSLLIKKLELMISNNKYDEFFNSEQSRRTYFHSLAPMFDIIESKLTLKNDENYCELKRNYLDIRTVILSYIQKCILKQNEFKRDKIENFINMHKLLDNQLSNVLLNNSFNLYYEVYINYCKETIVKISADSELIMDGIKLSSENVLFESKENRQYDLWVSNGISFNHWMVIDLGIIRKIYKILIEHYNYVNDYITNKFDIYISNDSEHWKFLYGLAENDKVTTFIDLDKPINFRFFKLIIIEPNKGKDLNARIRKIEIIGKE
ncbi:discoidin domain-containing protein, partial [Lachnoclostridium sp.]|uniref:discoidin domain-containing protein n=1 Tax=Lachnoclostridium sp. TaxID=2028282 RepID=UPI00289E10E9